MALTSWIYDHFDLYLTPVTLTFNLPEKCFKRHFSSSRTTTVQNYFWNSCINVQLMARTSSIYDHFDLYLTPVTLNLPEKMFQTALLLLEGKNCAKLVWNPCINVQVMLRGSSIHVYDHFDLYLTPVTLTFNLPIKMFQMALLLLKGTNCAKLFWNPCIIVQVMVRTNSDRRTDALTHAIHRTKIVTTMVRLPASGLNKNCFKIIFDLYSSFITCIQKTVAENLNSQLKKLQATNIYKLGWNAHS